MENNSCDVLIVGAGPTGLMMACQLALHKISFRIIDKKAHPTSYSGALIMQARSLEIFRQMRMDKRLQKAGKIVNEVNFFFNGRKRGDLNIRSIGKDLSQFPFLIMLEQSKTEQLFLNFLKQYGHNVERKTMLTNFQEHEHGINCIIQRKGEEEEIIKASYLIAADGSHSIIRKKLKISFNGKTYKQPLFITDCKAETQMPPDEISFSIADSFISGFFPLPGERWRIDGAIANKKTITFADVEKIVNEESSLPIKLFSSEWFSVFHSHQHCAETFHLRHCFLAGDAAHIHSPIGAQGMNTGMQDAYNLAWKLAFVIQGKAKPAILETYEIERLRVAKRIIRSTGKIFRLIVSGNILVRIFCLYILPLILNLLLTVVKKNRKMQILIFRFVSEIGINYRRSPLSDGRSAVLKTSRIKPGDRLPLILYFEKENEINIQDKINTHFFHLFIFTQNTIPRRIFDFLKKYKHILTSEIVYPISGNKVFFERMGILKEGFCLVRPDMYISYISNNLETEMIEKYFGKYFN